MVVTGATSFKKGDDVRHPIEPFDGSFEGFSRGGAGAKHVLPLQKTIDSRAEALPRLLSRGEPMNCDRRHAPRPQQVIPSEATSKAARSRRTKRGVQSGVPNQRRSFV